MGTRLKTFAFIASVLVLLIRVGTPMTGALLVTVGFVWLYFSDRISSWIFMIGFVIGLFVLFLALIGIA